MTSRLELFRPKYVGKRRHRVILTLAVAALVAISTALPAAADGIRGGKLYDKWWNVNGEPVPTGDHPLYPAAGGQSGSSTFRCKECHGWDYKGAAGAYGPGSSHFTGIPGVFGSALTPAQMFDLIKLPDGDGTGGTIPNGHAFGPIGWSDTDIDDVVEFLQTLLIDTDLYIDINGDFIGDEAQGQMNYDGPGQCGDCHGPDGTWINFGTPENPEWVGTVASHNPWEFIHKVRIGQPAAPMPSWIGKGGSDQGAADMGFYVQLNFPTGDPDPPDPPDVPAASGAGALVLLLTLLGLGSGAIRRRR